MKIKIRARHALLGIASVAALASAIANSTPAAQSVFSKKIDSGASPASSVVPGEEMVSRLIVKHRARRGDKLEAALQAADIRGLAIPTDLQMTILRPMSGGAHVVRLDQAVPLTQAHAIAERLKNDRDIELAEPDRIMRAATTLTPADPGYTTSQWHYKAAVPGNIGGTNLPDAWWMTTGSGTIRIAVLDTGYRQHEDFGAAPGNILQGYDFIADTAIANDGDGRDADARDPGDSCSTDANPKSSWHGTHVAGTIGAAMNNVIADKPHGTGVAPQTSILPIRVLGKCGGLTSDIVDGMRWAAGLNVPGAPVNGTPAHVLNLSLGGSGSCSAAFQSAVNDMISANKTVVVASGNSGAIGVSQPANCNGVIAVTAHAVDGDNASYANIGSQVTISAPGGGCGTMSSGCTPLVSPSGLGVYSLSNLGANAPGADNYAVRAGTSMAAPHVSGVIALMLALKPMLVPIQIKSYLQSAARPHPVGSTCAQTRYTGLCGEGLLDAFVAVNKANDHAPIVSLVNPYQVVAPNAVVSLSSNDLAAPGTGRTITAYDWSQLSGATVGVISNANTSNATFTAPTNGTYTFRHTVTDSMGKTGTATATVRVNSAPILAPVSDQAVAAGSSVSFTVSATDPDNDRVVFNAETLPHETATLNPTTGAFSWPNTVAGTYSLVYRASDPYGGSATGAVKITVAAPAKSGGGGIDGDSLAGLALLAGLLRIRRLHKARNRWPR
jgi:serine protease